MTRGKRQAVAVASASMPVVAAACSQPSHVDNDLDKEREALMERNRRMMQMFGVSAARDKVSEAAAAAAQKPAAPVQRKKPAAPKPRRPDARRRSGRLQGKGPLFMGEVDENDKVVGGGPSRKRKADGEAESSSDEDDGGLVDMASLKDLPVVSLTEQELQGYNERSSQEMKRGKKDKDFGICCHFCRQKALCTVPNCPRCVGRSKREQCAGKSYCTRCQDSQRQLCVGCLHTRYGESLAQTREAGWLCPHCYEKEHGKEHGWFCNSSDCMKKRGWQPTGIAIWKALEAGFVSSAHLVQANYQVRFGGGVYKYRGKVAGPTVGQAEGAGAQRAGQADGEEAAVDAAAVEPGAE